ncbi:MAG TPA: heme-binding domain-containing protein [Candidatus Kapabacteria bacterium]|nr:heme-binding domain-containing protein [Candidatus Kapabacteria bacterium]
MNKRIKLYLLIALAVIIIMQLVPIDRNNPPITAKVNWDSPQTKETFYKACADCHSNETYWPWYSYIAPISYIVSYDVVTGRQHFNISDTTKDERDEAAREVRRGTMPMAIYFPTHPQAKLSEQEKKQFIEGLIKTFGDKDPKDSKYNNQYN